MVSVERAPQPQRSLGKFEKKVTYSTTTNKNVYTYSIKNSNQKSYQDSIHLYDPN